MKRTDTGQVLKVMGRAVARHRLASGLTQEEVAERLSIGNEAVSRIERGVVDPSVTRLAELADIFQCELAELVTEASHRASDQANLLTQQLARLDSEDRQMVLDIVQRLTERLTPRRRRG